MTSIAATSNTWQSLTTSVPASGTGKSDGSFGQDLPGDPATSASSGTASASLTGLAKAAQSQSLAQSRAQLLALQEQSGSGRTHGSGHAHRGHRPEQPPSAPDAGEAGDASITAPTSATPSAQNDDESGTESALRLAQQAAAA